MEQKYIEFEDLKVGMIFLEKIIWGSGQKELTYNLITRKTSAKVWCLNFRSNRAPQLFWRRNYGDTDSYVFYVYGPDEIGTLVKNKKYLHFIIKWSFSGK